MKKLSLLLLLLVISGMALFGKTGKAVKGVSGKLTVTPRSDGLLLQLNAKDEWKHVTFCVRDVTNQENWEWHETIEAEVPVTTVKNSIKCELLFPFTEKDRNYSVWFNHYGNNIDEYADWTSEEDKAVSVKSIGGMGQYDILCANAQYWSPKRGLYLERFSPIVPAEISEDQQKLRVRAEIGHRWNSEERYFETNTISNTIWFPENENDEFTSFIKGKDKIFLTVQYVVNYKDVEYAQRFYGNWSFWDNEAQREIQDSNWFVDYDALNPAARKLPVVRIKSTENNQSNDFVAVPIAGHVKESQKSWGDYSNDGVPDPYYEACTITVENESGSEVLTKTAAQVKVRGNWTTSYDKKSLRIKYDKKQSMLGLNNGEKFKNWVLLACFKDASLLRDATALKLYKTMFPEYYASDSKLVEVFVNDVYWGVYLLAEQQETKSGRIEITEAEKNYEGTDIGYLIEFDSYSYTEVENEQFQINYMVPIRDYDGFIMQDPQKGYTIKSDVYSAAQKNFIQDYMNKLWRICYEASYNKTYYRFTDTYELEKYTPKGTNDDEKCKNCISQIIDVKSLADMYIFNELICDPDLYLTSFFMDIDFSKKGNKILRFEAPWDFDSTMGNKNFCSDKTSHDNITGISDMFAGTLQTDVNTFDDKIHGNPWMFIFIKCGWFQDLVKSEWAAAKAKNGLKAAEALISSYEAYAERLEFNRTRWENPANVIEEIYGPARDATYESQTASVNYLKQWLQTRYNALDSIIGGLK